MQLITLQPGQNRISDALPGRDGVITEAWRSGANGSGYYMFLVTINNKAVGVKAGSAFQDVIRDNPHDISDAIESVRFARGSLDGRNPLLLITATRNIDADEGLGDPATVYYDVYQLVSNGEAGTTGIYFAPVSEMASENKFCNSDLAMTKKFGFPLPDPYEGRNQDDGC